MKNYTINCADNRADQELDAVSDHCDPVLTLTILLQGPGIDWWLERVRKRWITEKFTYDQQLLCIECRALSTERGRRLQRIEDFYSRVSR